MGPAPRSTCQELHASGRSFRAAWRSSFPSLASVGRAACRSPLHRRRPDMPSRTRDPPAGSSRGERPMSGRSTSPWSTTRRAALAFPSTLTHLALAGRRHRPQPTHGLSTIGSCRPGVAGTWWAPGHRTADRCLLSRQEGKTRLAQGLRDGLAPSPRRPCRQQPRAVRDPCPRSRACRSAACPPELPCRRRRRSRRVVLPIRPDARGPQRVRPFARRWSAPDRSRRLRGSAPGVHIPLPCTCWKSTSVASTDESCRRSETT